MRAVVTVLGKDREGIIAQVSNVLWKKNINILDISQNVLQGVFAMIMFIEDKKDLVAIEDLRRELEEVGEKIGMKIIVMHEDVFNSMHTI